MAEYDEPLFPATIECHKHVHSSLTLHTAQLASSITCDPSLAVRRDVHLGAIVAMRDVRDGHRSAQLLQQPLNVLLATLSLLERPCYEGEAAHELQDAASCFLDLLLCGSFLSDDVT